MMRRWMSFFFLWMVFFVLWVGSFVACDGGQTGKPDGGQQDDPKRSCALRPNDCAAGEVCDLALGQCFPDCRAAGFRGCTEGERCDATLRRCVCDQSVCAAKMQPRPHACHPMTKLCVTRCTADSQCQAGEACYNGFCFKPGQQPSECTNEGDCKDSAKPFCDTTVFPAVCTAPPRECTTSANCANKPDNKTVCSPAGVCVQCTTQDDCGIGTNKLCIDNLCEDPPACADTATCHNDNKKTYCLEDRKNRGCLVMPTSCDADQPAKGENSAWTSQIEQSKGSIIYDPLVKRIAGASCWLPSPEDKPCTQDSDCPNEQSCDGESEKKRCGRQIPDGKVEISFAFYNQLGRFAILREHLVTHEGKGQILDEPTITTDPTNLVDGRARFALCLPPSEETYSFFTYDADDHPSNALCYRAP